MRLYFLRHGETDWNRMKKLQGQSDTELNANGIRQAEESAGRLKAMPFDAVFSSPLSRARVTAETIAAAHGLRVFVDGRLTEMGFGLLEGTEPEYRLIDKNRELLFTDPVSFRPAEGGESFDEVSERCQSFLDYLLTTEYNNVLVVTHGALIQNMIRTIKKTPLSEFWGEGCLQNCNIYETDYPYEQEEA